MNVDQLEQEHADLTAWKQAALARDYHLAELLVSAGYPGGDVGEGVAWVIAALAAPAARPLEDYGDELPHRTPEEAAVEQREFDEFVGRRHLPEIRLAQLEAENAALRQAQEQRPNRDFEIVMDLEEARQKRDQLFALLVELRDGHFAAAVREDYEDRVRAALASPDVPCVTLRDVQGWDVYQRLKMALVGDGDRTIEFDPSFAPGLFDARLLITRIEAALASPAVPSPEEAK